MDKLKNEKFELENQSKEHFKQIEKLTANYVSIKFIYSYVMKNLNL